MQDRYRGYDDSAEVKDILHPDPHPRMQDVLRLHSLMMR